MLNFQVSFLSSPLFFLCPCPFYILRKSCTYILRKLHQKENMNKPSCFGTHRADSGYFNKLHLPCLRVARNVVIGDTIRLSIHNSNSFAWTFCSQHHDYNGLHYYIELNNDRMFFSFLFYLTSSYRKCLRFC